MSAKYYLITSDYKKRKELEQELYSKVMNLIDDFFNENNSLDYKKELKFDLDLKIKNSRAFDYDDLIKTIGFLSRGHKFALNGNEFNSIEYLFESIANVDGKIINEYDEEIPMESFKEIIESNKNNPIHNNSSDKGDYSLFFYNI